MGLESGSERILNYLKGGTVTLEQNKNAVNILKKHKFVVDASFIIGSPTETKWGCLQTLNFLKRSKIDGGETYVLLPFPGTDVWKYGKQRGLLNDYMDWNNFEMYFEDDADKRITVADKISRDELQVKTDMGIANIYISFTAVSISSLDTFANILGYNAEATTLAFVTKLLIVRATPT